MKKSKLARIAKSESARNSIWIIGEKIAQMLISFIITILSARYLGPSNYGILNYGISFVTFFLSFVKLGIDSVIVKELIDHPKKEGTLLGTSIVFRLLSSGLSMLLIFLCVLVLKPNETVIVITTVLQSISLIFQAINIFDFWFQSKLQSKYVSITKIISYSIAGAYKIFLLMNGFSVEWFALSSTIDYLLVCVLLYSFYKKKGGQKLHFNKKDGIDLIKKSYHFIISGAMIVIYTQIDKIMIGSMMDAAQVGYYAAAVSIHSAFGFIPEALVISARPTLFRLQNTDDRKYLRRLKQTFAIISWSCAAFAFIVTIASQLIIKYTYGEEYLNAVIPLIILVWAVPFAYIGNVRGIWTVGVGLQKYIKRYLAIGAVINIVLNAIFIPVFGIVGAAIATLITEVFTGIFAPMLYNETRIISKIAIQAIILNIDKDQSMINTQIKRILKKKKIKDLTKADDAMLKKHPEWAGLDAGERSKNRNKNKFLRIMKNLYPGWKESDKNDYVSDAVFQTELLPKLNWINNGYLGLTNGNSYFSDKNYQSIFLDNIEMPKTIVRRINGEMFDSNYNVLSFQKALKIMREHKQLVFKVSIGSSHGRGVKLINSEDYEKQLEKFGNNIVVQERIKQSAFLSNFNDSSVNILRITTIIVDSEPYILSSILRVGAPGSFCDHQGFHGMNPRIVKIDKNGKLVGPAIDPDDGFVYEDVFGKKIEGTVPNFEHICDIVKRECLKLAHTRIIGWDLTLDEKNNPICVEFNNVYPGVVQSQMVCGPIFAQKTKSGDKIIDLIKRKSSKKIL